MIASTSDKGVLSAEKTVRIIGNARDMFIRMGEEG
jgi:hypothetical protein